MTIFVLMLAVIGGYGLVCPKNILSFLMSAEVLVLAACTHVVEQIHVGSVDPESAILILFMLIMAGAELAIGLALIMRTFKNHESLCMDSFQTLKE